MVELQQTARQLQQLLGQKASLEKFVLTVRVRALPFHFWLKDHWSKSFDTEFAWIIVPPALKEDLWWHQENMWMRGTSLRVYTDVGWLSLGQGALVDPLRMPGAWSLKETWHRINWLELQAVYVSVLLPCSNLQQQ